MRSQVVFLAFLLIVGMSCTSEVKQNAAVVTQCGDSLSVTAIQSPSDLQPKNKEKAKRFGHNEIVQRIDSILHLGDKMKYDSVTGNVDLCGVMFHVIYPNKKSSY